MLLDMLVGMWGLGFNIPSRYGNHLSRYGGVVSDFHTV